MPPLKPMSDIRWIVVHCSATPAKMDIGRREIDLWHRQRGFTQIGYHFVIRRDGSIEAGRPIELPGAHAQGYNEYSYGICLVGGVKSLPEAEPEANYTVEQMASLADLIDILKSGPAEKATVLGHHDLPGPHARSKACPCFDVPAWVEAGKPAHPIPPTVKGPKLA